MRVLIFCFIVFTGAGAFAGTTKSLKRLSEEALLRGSRRPIEESETFRKDRYLLFSHGPTLTKEDSFKYGIEYSYEALFETNLKTGSKTLLKQSVSIMELTYCSFLYKDPNDYRFRRRTYEFNENHKMIK